MTTMPRSQILDEYAFKVRNGLRIRAGVAVLPHLALGLTGEAGEVADLIKKAQYEDGTLEFDQLEAEMGDVLWYLTALCNRFGLSIEELAVANIKKLAAKRPQDYTPMTMEPTP